MQLYAGLDLHSRNTYIGIMDKDFNRVFHKRVHNQLDLILKTGGAAYLAQQLVHQQIEHGELFLVEQAPVIERTAFAIYCPSDERKGYMRTVLDILR